MHGTVQYSAVQYSTVQYSTVQYSTVQYSTVQYSTSQGYEDSWGNSHLSVPYSFLHVSHPGIETFAKKNAPSAAATNFLLRCMTTPSGKRNRSMRRALSTLEVTTGEQRR